MNKMTKAANFYKKLDPEIVSRSTVEATGKHYPVLNMEPAKKFTAIFLE